MADSFFLFDGFFISDFSKYLSQLSLQTHLTEHTTHLKPSLYALIQESSKIDIALKIPCASSIRSAILRIFMFSLQ